MGKLQKEMIFHDDRFGGGRHPREKAEKYYSINGCVIGRYQEIISDICGGKKLLEYGCGTGRSTIHWLERGAIVTGIDISPVCIEKSKEYVFRHGYSAEFYIMDAEKTSFDNDSFDVVVGTGVLHHLDIRSAYGEISRILKADGKAVFVEALGDNLLINFYRKLTPSMRTADEQPLKHGDILLASQYFREVVVSYYNLFAIAAVPFKNTVFFDKLLEFLSRLDSLVFRIPFLRRYAWMAILEMSQPVIGLSQEGEW